MPDSKQTGDVLADRYRLEDLLAETAGGRFWRAHDSVLHRPVAVHIISREDERADAVIDTARRLGPLGDRRVLKVLDADMSDQICFVVVEWGQGESLDIVLTREGPLPPRRAAWLVSEVADSLASAHALGLSHGRLAPENVLIDHHGHVRIIGFAIEAVLSGLPASRETTDVTDLGGLLYAGLTGKWAGVSRSTVPVAPTKDGLVLRPRQVRAGIPRQLDALCDEVLNGTHPSRAQRSGTPRHTARSIADALSEFVGDPTGVFLPVAPPSSQTTGSIPVVPPMPPAPPAPDPAPTVAAQPNPKPKPNPEAEPDPAVAATDLPTEAGMPVFHDDVDDVEWLRARAETPAPPPPPQPQEAKPLFAPDPPEGQPVRRPRAGSEAASRAQAAYWPWDSSSTDAGNGGTGHSGAWDTGVSTGTDERVPGQSWIRLAMLVGLALLVFVAAVAAYQLGLGSDTEDPLSSDPGQGSTSSSELTAFGDLLASDFDPQGAAPHDENPDLVPLAIDGDPETAWQTLTYQQNFGPDGLKAGVGLVIDVGATRGVREIVVTVAGGETTVAAYVTQAAPTGVADLTPVGTASGADAVTISLDEAVSGQYVTVWLTSIPAVDDGFRGTISEVEVRG